MDFQTHKKQLMKNPAFKKAYEESEIEYQIARAVIKARIENGYTQKQLAARLKTKQSVISRVENAKTTPSISFLKRVAEVLETQLQVKFT